MLSDRYEATDPNTDELMCFEPYVPKHHLMQRLAAAYMQETPDGVFYRSSEGGLVFIPREIPPLQPSDDRRSGGPKR